MKRDAALLVTRVRGATAVCWHCCDQVLGFEMADGTVLRLRLTAAQRAELADFLSKSWPNQRVTCPDCAQSERSSGSPQSAGSMPDDGQNTAPAHKSSSAAVGE